MSESTQNPESLFAAARNAPRLRTEEELSQLVRAASMNTGTPAEIGSLTLLQLGSLAVIGGLLVTSAVVIVLHRPINESQASATNQSTPTELAVPQHGVAPLQASPAASHPFAPADTAVSRFGSTPKTETIQGAPVAMELYTNMQSPTPQPSPSPSVSVDSRAPIVDATTSVPLRSPEINTTASRTSAEQPLHVVPPALESAVATESVTGLTLTNDVDSSSPLRLTSAFIVEGGAAAVPMLGGFRNVFWKASGYEPENFAQHSLGAAVQGGLGMEVPITSWLVTTMAFRYTQIFVTYSSTREVYLEQSYPTPGEHGFDALVYTANLNLGEVSVEPGIRIMPWGGPIFLDGAISAGLVVQQSGRYFGMNYLPPGVWLNAPEAGGVRTTTSLGKPQMQWDLHAGLGGVIHLSKLLSLELQIRGDYGLLPFFTDNYMKMLSIAPMVGLRFNGR